MTNGRPHDDRNIEAVAGGKNHLPQAVAKRQRFLRDVGHFTHHESGNTAEQSTCAHLPQHGFQLVQRFVDILNKQQPPLGLQLPGSAHKRHQDGQVATPQGAAAGAVPQDLRAGIPAEFGGQHSAGKNPGHMIEAARLHAVAEGVEHGTVESDQSRFCGDGVQQMGDIAEADEYFGMSGDELKVEMLNDFEGAIATTGAKDGVNGRIGEKSVQILGPLLGRSGERGVERRVGRPDNHAVACRFQHCLAGGKIVRGRPLGRRNHPNGSALLERRRFYERGQRRHGGS